jgi:recombination protein RecR
MAQSIVGPEIERLIQLLARLPGLGPRSARRAALHLMKRREGLLEPWRAPPPKRPQRLGLQILRQCRYARALFRVPQPGARRIAAGGVEDVGDLWALERAGATRGRYHVLGGHALPLDGIGPDDLNIASLGARVRDGRGPRGDPGAQCDGRRPDHGPLRHGPARRLRRQGDPAGARRTGRRASWTTSTTARSRPR